MREGEEGVREGEGRVREREREGRVFALSLTVHK